jgi:hypothetical protein
MQNKAFATLKTYELLMVNIPNDLLVFSLTWFNHQALVIHLVNIACCRHVAQDVVLQFRYRLQRVCDVLVLLNVTDHLRRLCTLGKIDEIGSLDYRRDAIFNKSEIREVDT